MPRFAAARNVVKAWILLIGVCGLLAFVGWTLDGLGFDVFVKTTGCEAMFIHSAPLQQPDRLPHAPAPRPRRKQPPQGDQRGVRRQPLRVRHGGAGPGGGRDALQRCDRP